MALYKSNGFNLAGKVIPLGDKLTEKDFPTESHIKICLSKKYIELIDENVEDANFDEYESMKVDELKELLIESGKTEDDLKGKLKADLIEMLRSDKDDEK